jgi:ketosteroid isomerase-like protein
MRHLLLVLTLVLATDRSADRDALLAADRALSQKTASLGLVSGFMPALTDDAAFLYPGAPLLRGLDRIRAFVGTGDTIQKQTWSPVFADVSADGRLGYSYGWTRAPRSRGKYLACWQKTGNTWRLAAYASTRPMADTASSPPAKLRATAGAQVGGGANSHELIEADSAFAAMSVASGGKIAFLAYAADNAISFGGGPQFTEGREAIGAGFDGFPAGAVLEWRPVAAKIAASGDLGCTVGEASISSLHHYTKYLTIWRRQNDGSWKFVADGGNTRPTP